MISKKSLVAVLDKPIILTITAQNDNAKSISVQCACMGFLEALEHRLAKMQSTARQGSIVIGQFLQKLTV